jgi:hypothetical protein
MEGPAVSPRALTLLAEGLVASQEEARTTGLRWASSSLSRSILKAGPRKGIVYL